jgi:hypothetical protein
MQGIEGIGPQADDERVFSRKPLMEADLPDGEDDLLRRLGALPPAAQAPQRAIIGEWDPERWDGLA